MGRGGLLLPRTMATACGQIVDLILIRNYVGIDVGITTRICKKKRKRADKLPLFSFLCFEYLCKDADMNTPPGSVMLNLFQHLVSVSSSNLSC